MTQGWLKVYFRDADGVMRSIEGVKFLPGSTLVLAKSVYTQHYDIADSLGFKVKNN